MPRGKDWPLASKEIRKLPFQGVSYSVIIEN